MTTRRTAKITKPATKPYEPVVLYRVYDKESNACLGYLAPSRDGREFYQVNCDDRGRWHCTCKATVECCCHVVAVQQICAIRVAEGRPGCFQGQSESLPSEEKESMQNNETNGTSGPAQETTNSTAATTTKQSTTQILRGPAGLTIMHSDRRGRRGIETSTLNGNRAFSILR